MITTTKAPSNLVLSIALLGLLFNLFLVGYNMTLWDDDEAAYAGFALRMLETGDWVNPTFTWSDVHRKTPFHFWTIALSYLIFGVNEFALRVPAALAVLLTVLAVWKWGRPLFGKPVSDWAALILSTSFLVLAMGKMSLTDAWLMCFETSALLALFNYLQQPSWRWNLIFWLSISIGILVKGPPILILTGGVWLGLAILHPERKRLIGTHPWIFGVLALLPFLCWVWLSYRSDGGALLTFLYKWYVVERIGGAVFGQTGPPGYHLVIAFVAFLPWLPFFLLGLWRSFRYARRDTDNKLLMLWLVFGWIFYELMSSKLPSYAMGAHPAFAIAAAKVLVESLNVQKIIKIGIWVLLALLWAAFSIAFCFVLPQFFGEANILFFTLPLMLLPAVMLLIATSLRPFWMGLWGLVTFALIWGVGGGILDASPAKSSRAIATNMTNIAEQSGKTVENLAFVGFSARQLRQSFPFYVERQLGKPKEWTPEEALNALASDANTLLLVGEDALPFLESKLGTLAYKHCKIDKSIPWHSLNDQLKPHPFAVVWNF